MRATLTTNARAVAARMERRARALAPAEYLQAREIAERLTHESRGDLVVDVYAVPPKRTKRGRNRWNRTGELLQSEHWEARGVTIRHVNRSGHYKARLAYGKAGGRPARPPQRPWRGPRVVLARNRAWIRERWRWGVQRAISLGQR